MNDLALRKTPHDLLKLKAEMLNKLNTLDLLNKDIGDTLEDFHLYTPYNLQYNWKFFGQDAQIKWIDQKCWRYLIELYELHKYMACTEYEKLEKDLEAGNFPEFTEENLDGYLQGLTGAIKNNVKDLLKRVYDKLITGHYYTGTSWSSKEKKKRNNKGVDKNFILTTHDYTCVFGYGWNKTSVTDDLEKICYILDGERLPNSTIKEKMRVDKNHEAENKYFKIKVCKNGNTHYTIFPETLIKLNKYCSDSNKIGEDIKIKIFQK